MDAQTIKKRAWAIAKGLGPWWHMPLAFLIWLFPALFWGEFYLGQGLNQVISLMLLPFALKIRQADQKSHRFFFWSLGCALFSFPLGNNILVFMALGFGLLFLIEFYLGKVGYLPALLVLLMTPFLSSWLTAFTFSLQLSQSAWIGGFLAGNLGMDVAVQGNRFLLNGRWFSVDAACLGIHILSMGFFIAVLILSIFEKRKTWGWWEIGLWLVLAALFSYLANLIRMFVIVLFQSPPNTLGHELTGLFALAFFVGLPLYLGIWWRSSFISQEEKTKTRLHVSIQKGWKGYFPKLWALCLAALVCWRFWAPAASARDKLESLSYPGYDCRIASPGIAQLSQPNSLIYIKAPTSPWRADHHPSICWQGTGFDVQQIHLDNFAGREVFKALLISQTDTLHTAWWYDNGQRSTPYQWEWRKWAFQGEGDFYLVNVSKPSEKELDKALYEILENGLYSFGLGK